MPSRIPAILSAQWKSFLSYRSGGLAGRFASGAAWVVWYSLWLVVAGAAGVYTSTSSRPALLLTLPWALLGVSAFWQLGPILTANLGAAVELRKLLLYPIPVHELFEVELLVRLGSAAEMLLVLTGIAVGLLGNSEVSPALIIPALLLWIAFNLLIAVGIRTLLARLLSIRRLREVLVLLIVLSAALPQLLTQTGAPTGVPHALLEHPHGYLPWTAAARFLLADSALASCAILVIWTAVALAFGVWQFQRSLLFDETAARATGETAPTERWTASLYRLPGRILPDPLAAILEKELRSLARSPRFRLVFLMGFSFGMIVWWPVFRHSSAVEPWQIGYPAAVSGYALLLLAEMAFWNQFGLDRASAALYLSSPVPFTTVFHGKNLAALACVGVEITCILLACQVLRVPTPPHRLIESYGVTLTLTLFCLAVGNLSSVRHPRPIDPEHSWGRTAGRFQLMLLLLFPLLVAPLALAYLAAYAFHSTLAFYGVLAFDLAAGIAAWHVATGSAAAALEHQKETFLAALGQSAGPIAAE